MGFSSVQPKTTREAMVAWRKKVKEVLDPWSLEVHGFGYLVEYLKGEK